uniref:Deoxyribose-phosphate aldolase n=1 Tax=uncultured candidate division Zixibacteria bacterium Rifle_16ft_4_minimus_38126 TaxID=1665171 RepID=A0A0H4T9X4_UNCZI|nr:deoxyribose-phosphate aldolase, deoxyribose-phosphate aldolase [uncultured candidate division Zixibacteria bacterium Rifle_16ft_4_minimus_38126]
MSKIIELNRLIDHTLLKPEAASADIKKLCQEALAYQFATVFVNPVWVKVACSLLKGSQTKVGSVVGFPLGANTPEVKLKEAEKDIENGANEIDMVMNFGHFKEGDYKYVEEEIKQIREVCSHPIILKVIIETGLLTDVEKRNAALLVKECGGDFVKTSTGFGPTGAKVEDIILLRQVVGPDFKIKASGGIRDYQTVVKLIEAGAKRIGTSASIRIMQEYKQL